MTTKRIAGTAIFAVAFVVMGLPDFGHGVAWPELRADLDRPLADLGALLGAQALGYLVVAMSTGRLAARWTLEGLVVRTTLSSGVGLALIAFAPAWPVVLVGGVLAGAGAGGMDTGFNAAVALRNDGRLMGLLHAGYGIGAAIGPVVVGASLAIGSGWRPAYGLFALASFALVVPLLRHRLGDAPPQEVLGSPRGMLLPCLTFFVYVGLEVTVGQWAFTFLTEERSMSDLAASLLVAAYWVGLTAGRLWLGLTGHRLAVDRVLAMSMVGTLASALLLWLGGPIAPLGLPLAGLALSVVFPLLMLVTPERVGAERAAAAVGWQTASSSIGVAAVPALAGVVMASVGVDAYGLIAVALAIGLSISVAVLRSGPRDSVGGRRSVPVPDPRP